MLRKIVVTAVFLIGLAMAAVAQNSIDRMLDSYSVSGLSKFTSVIERDPDTRKVNKMVKVLKIEHADISMFVKAFKKESGTGDFIERYGENGCMLMLTVKKPSQNRIYLMRCDGQPGGGNTPPQRGSAKITLIVNYK